MKTTICSLLLLLCGLSMHAQNLYSRAFGNPNNQVVVFLHGGPGYNCANFEGTTAQALADKGFFVIVYDRRGEGRSSSEGAEFTFKQTFNDLNELYSRYGIQKAMLIGHSFGGIVALLYTKQFPEKVHSIVLAGAPLSLQESFAQIIDRCKKIYQAKNDSTNLNYLSMLEKMDKSTLQYSSFCFAHAMQNGFYSPQKPTEEALKLYQQWREDTTLSQYGSQMTPQAPQGFWQNEHYTTLDLTETVQSLKQMDVSIYGVYGQDDGLYSEAQIEKLKSLIGASHVFYWEQCSHNVFIDQQKKFIDAIGIWGQ